jgi:hypothetical protein
MDTTEEKTTKQATPPESDPTKIDRNAPASLGQRVSAMAARQLMMVWLRRWTNIHLSKRQTQSFMETRRRLARPSFRNIRRGEL